MRTTRYRSIILAHVLALSLLAGACAKGKVAVDPRKPLSPALDEIALQTSHVEQGIRALTDAKRVLLKEELKAAGIDETKIAAAKARSNARSRALLKVALPTKELNARAATYDSFDATAKADLTRLFNDVRGAYQELASQGLYPQNKAVDTALAIISAALGLLSPIFGGQ